MWDPHTQGRGMISHSRESVQNEHRLSNLGLGPLSSPLHHKSKPEKRKETHHLHREVGPGRDSRCQVSSDHAAAGAGLAQERGSREDTAQSIEAPAPSGRPLAQLSYQIISEALGCRSGLVDNLAGNRQQPRKQINMQLHTMPKNRVRERWQRQPGTHP